MNEELVDVVDEQGNPTDQTVSRAVAHATELRHRVALIWIINDRDELLIQQRSGAVETAPNKWDCRFGGHVSAGQQSLDAAQRELEEEIGIAVGPDDLIPLGPGYYESADLVPGKIVRHVTEDFLFYWQASTEKPALDPAEVQAVRWIPLSNLEAWIAHTPHDFILHGQEEPRIFELIRTQFGPK